MQPAYLSRRTFFRFLAVYGLFLTLIFSLILPSVFRSTNYLRQSTLEQYQLEMEKNTARLDEHLQALKITLSYLVQERQYAMLLNKSSPQGVDFLLFKELIGHIASIANAYPMVRDVMLLSKDRNNIVGRFQCFTAHSNLKDLFYGDFFSVSQAADLTDFWKMLDRETSLAQITSIDYGKYDALLFTFPLLDLYMQERGRGFFCVPVQRAIQEIAPAQYAENGEVWLENGEGQIIWRDSSLQNPPNALQVRCFSGLMQCWVVYAVPENIALEKVHPLIGKVYVALLAALGGGLILVFIFSWHNHRPLRRLSRLARSVSSAQGATSARNEYEYVNQTLIALEGLVKSNESQLREQRTLLQNAILEKALMGYFDQNQEIFHQLFPDFPERYVLALLLFEQTSENAVAQMVSQNLVMEHILSERIRFPVYHLTLGSNQIVLILPEAEGTAAQAEGLRDAFLNVFQIPVQISLSDVSQGLGSLSEAYSLVARVQRCRASYPTNPPPVLTSAAFENESAASTMDYAIFQRLYEAVCTANKESALAYLQRIKKMMLEEEEEGQLLPASAYRKTLEFVMTILIRVKQEHFSSLMHISLMNPECSQPLDDYMHCLEQYTVVLCDTLSALQLTETNLDDRIFLFLQENITNMNLYQKTVTEEFRITEHTLQTVIRNRTGMSFAEYVEQKRLELAHRLLLRTDLTVQQIARQSGFSLYNTFYKAFKRRWSCSPSEYRACRRDASIPPRQ